MVNELGEFLEKLRGKTSLREVSEKSGLSHSYIRDLELGVNRVTKTPIRPTPETLTKLAEAYNYPYEELMIKAGYIEGKAEGESMHPAQKLLSYIEQGLTNEQIRKRADFFVEFMQLNDEQADEFMSWVRWQLSTKNKPPVSASKSEEL